MRKFKSVLAVLMAVMMVLPVSGLALADKAGNSAPAEFGSVLSEIVNNNDAGVDGEGEIAEITPEYVESVLGIENEEKVEIDAGEGTGFSLEGVDGKNESGSQNSDQATTIPSKYDARNYNLVTPVKDQGFYQDRFLCRADCILPRVVRIASIRKNRINKSGGNHRLPLFLCLLILFVEKNAPGFLLYLKSAIWCPEYRQHMFGLT